MSLLHRGHTRTWLLYPVFARSELDTKERYKFFGLARQRACGIGSGPRKGHSIFRQCTPHATRDDIDSKRQAVAAGGPDSKAAEASLLRRGLKPTITCTSVLVDCKDAILSFPYRLFGGLYAYDTMHHIFINTTGYYLEAIVDFLPPSKLRELDARSRKFAPFRDKLTGEAARRVPTVTKLSYLTAEQKVVCLYTMTHAIGHQALLFPEGIRASVLTAASSLQVIFFVTRGKRPFTEAEHNFVFEVVGKKFWNALARIVSWREQEKARKVRRSNLRKPPSKRKKVKLFRATLPDPDESSDTIDSDPMDDDVPPHFLKSDKIVPHAFVHMAEQVKMGGTYQFHNTSAMESAHPGCIQQAGTHVRIYNAVNVTEGNMLLYNLNMQLFDEIAGRISRGNVFNMCLEHVSWIYVLSVCLDCVF